MRAVFGLGNPGRKYEGTRHNVGYAVVDRVAKAFGIAVSRRRFKGLIGEAEAGAGRLLLVKPLTYMNESGLCVQAVAAWHKLALDDCLVVCDDLDLEPGVVRVRRKGSSGGHNGLKSIAASLGSTGFPRLRLGIGRPAVGDPIDFVLARFDRRDEDAMNEAIADAADAVQCWVEKGIEACMNRFN